MNDKEASEYYRDDKSSDCSILKAPCTSDRDCRRCGFAQETFRFDMQMKLEAERKKMSQAELAEITRQIAEEQDEVETKKTRRKK